MSTPDIKNPVGLPKEVSGVNLPTEVQAQVNEAKAEVAKTPTGIANINIHTAEGRAAVTQTLLDLGLTMPEFLSGTDSKFIANLGKEGKGQLAHLATTAAGLTAPGTGGTAATADLQGRWADFIAGQSVGNAMDVNSLVQFVLREAYMENTKDLHFYAQKVRFYNELKKMIRNELTSAREYLAKQAGSKPEDNLKGGTYTNSVSGTGPLSFPTEPQFDESTGAMVPHDPTANYDLGFTKKEDLETYIKNLEEKLNSVGDDAQLANVDLQNMLQKQQQTLQMMSNISKMLHDTAMAIIRKIGS